MHKIRWLLLGFMLLLGGSAIASSIIPQYFGSFTAMVGGRFVDENQTPGNCAVWITPSPAATGAQLSASPCPAVATYPVVDFVQTSAESSCSGTCTLGTLSVTTGTSNGPNDNWYVTVTENIPATLSGSTTEYGFEGCIEVDGTGSDGVGLVTQTTAYGTCSATSDYTIVSSAVASGEVAAAYSTFTITYTAYYANSTTIDAKCLGANSASTPGTMDEGLCGITAVPE